MDMIQLSAVLKHYKRPEIQEAILANALDREVAVKYGDKGFGKRPDILSYPADVMEFVKNGATSFHASEERWKNPMYLSPMMNKKDMEDLRIGWDLLIDIDCKIMEYSRIAADLLIKALKHYGVKSVSCKFSGNKGFHLGVPFEAFPRKIHNIDTRLWFPEGARKVAVHLGEMIKKKLSAEIMGMEGNDLDRIKKKTEKAHEDIVKDSTFDPFSILDIDTLLISSRHLYRMPYCYHEKSGLISVTLDPKHVLEFEKPMAAPQKLEVNENVFLDRSKAKQGECRELFLQSYDANITIKEDNESRKRHAWDADGEAVPEQFFPPCIQASLKGLRDGRKRFVFILTNFLTSLGWSYEQIEERLKEWNKKNPEPLREVNLVGHLRYHKKHKKKILPPNCANKAYYADFGVCHPNALCSKIKNPVNYAKIRARELNKQKGKKEKPKLTHEQEEFIRKRKEKEKAFKERMKAARQK